MTMKADRRLKLADILGDSWVEEDGYAWDTDALCRSCYTRRAIGRMKPTQARPANKKGNSK